MNNKKVLLIAGGGTLGRYTARELLKSECSVDIICLEDNVSNDLRLKFYKASADITYLEEFLNGKYYDAIVNFIHYTDTEMYKKVHKFLTSKTDQLVFLSSYRVYADLQHPVTETAPQLYDTVKETAFLQHEDYAVPKSKNEKYIREESGTKNWTIVRPVISFSDKRLDMFTISGHRMLELAKENQAAILPEAGRNLTAGLDWAGNSGKLIAGLLFKEKALGEAFTVSSAQNLKWHEVADIYTELVGTKFEWIEDTERFKELAGLSELPWIMKYDRFFDREIDNSKILRVTGFNSSDFIPIKEGIKIELENIKKGSFEF